MQIVRGLKGLSNFKGCILTLGNFDGVHLGHAKILRRVSKEAGKLRVPSVTFTFEPHPLKVVSPGLEPPLILSLEDKTSLISDFGIDCLVLARFTREFAKKHPDEFLDTILKRLAPKCIIVGHDFSFGKGRSGTVKRLITFGIKHGIKVEVVSPLKRSGDTISSSRIRELILHGDVKAASKLLGRLYSLCGKVKKGAAIGRTLGYPTANLQSRAELIPPAGVYAAYARVGKNGRTLFPAAINIGTAPTFKRGRAFIEAHLLDFKGTLYDKLIKVYFIKRLRGEECFATAKELQRQIAKDVLRVRRATKS